MGFSGVKWTYDCNADRGVCGVLLHRCSVCDVLPHVQCVMYYSVWCTAPSLGLDPSSRRVALACWVVGSNE